MSKNGTAPTGLIRVDEVLFYLQQDRYMSKPETAAYTNLSERFLEKHKEIPRYRLPAKQGCNGNRQGKTMFRKSEIDRWYSQYRETENGKVNLDAIVQELKRK